MKKITDPQLIEKLNRMLAEKKGMQRQEEFSNPTQWPGFSSLPKKEQLEKISSSLFDPANISPTGTSVQPGTFESKSQRFLSSNLLPFLTPGGEFVKGGSALAEISNAILNPVNRIASGTASNIAYELPEIKSKKELSKKIEESSLLNTALEVIPGSVGAAKGLAEIVNPIKYMKNKADVIKDEASVAKKTMDEKYAPVREKFDDLNLTINPEKYLEQLGIVRSDLSPGGKIIHDNFINEPTFANLHDLQSKLGSDWAKTASHPSTYEKSELYEIMRGNTNDKIQEILSRDPKSLMQYNDATEFARNTYYPYLSSDTLRTVSRKGSEADISSDVLKEAIKKSSNKVIGKQTISEGANEVIPQGHALRQHLNDMENKENMAKLYKAILPPTIGSFGGGLGIGSGIAASGALLSPLGNTALSSTIQNPMAEKIAKALLPVYLTSGRGGIDLYNEK